MLVTGSSGSMYSCYDYNTGNSYNVSKIGNQTHVNGYNSNTGSSWSQNTAPMVIQLIKMAIVQTVIAGTKQLEIMAHP